MATEDLSRSAFYPGKHYTGVRMQQGRVLTDDDYNEGERLQREAQRRTRLDVIGPCGSPDLGFAVANPTIAGGQIDFDIEPGTFYLGGLRLERQSGERFQEQSDWLLNPGQDAPGAGDERFDLVYLEAWQQPVSAVEDEELFEVALGGPDTATRLRTMGRVRVRPTSGDHCRAAWEELQAAWAAAGDGELAGDHELVPGSRLTVTFEPGGEADDLCAPQVAGGYLGAENQAIRVQLVDRDHFTWGFDNAAPLYRVQASADGTTITLLSEPRDQAHWPQAGQVVEILPWSAVLVNGEKLAEELEPGHLSRLADPYDPDRRTITLVDPLPPGFGEEWTRRGDAEDLRHSRFGRVGPREPYFFLRVWDRGADRDSEPALAIAPGPVALGTTGLRVAFGGTDHRPGDHWILAARPETPDRVVPWELEAERPPDGVRRFYAPLAVLHWSGGAGKVVDDCRKTFRPLTGAEVGGCCTYTVGDGVQSQGDLTSLQEAIQRLPPGGGEICLLPGDHLGPVVLADRDNVTIHGCGVHGRLRAGAGGADPTAAVLRIENCTRITVRSLAIVAAERVAVEIAGNLALATLEHVTLQDLEIIAKDRSAVVATGARYLTLETSAIRIEPLDTSLTRDSVQGKVAAVVVGGEDLRIEGNCITTDGGRGLQRSALGGLQILGGSERVEIRRNSISGGNGNGISLGSYQYQPVSVVNSYEATVDYYANYRHDLTGESYINVSDNGCVEVDPNPQRPADDQVPISDGALRDVRIVDNDIAEMGANGIAVIRFFDLGREPLLITTDRLTIERNRIRGCLRLEFVQLPAELRQVTTFGAIALADGEYLVVRDNMLEGNAAGRSDAICGVFILNGEGIVVDGNRILHNGRLADAANPPGPGLRGGIHIGLARPRTVPLAGGARQDGVPATRVHGNVVVSPEGRALKILAIGPVSVEGNQFTAHGSHSLKTEPMPGNRQDSFTGAAEVTREERSAAPTALTALNDALGGAVVSIVNLGFSNELYLQLLGLSGFGLSDELPEPSEAEATGTRLFAGGNVMFNDNQVVLDAYSDAVTQAVSVVTLFSFDDVSMVGNQCDADLLFDRILTNAFVMGFLSSVRVADNRFKAGVFNGLLSVLTWSFWFNSTTDNQGTHCFFVVGHPNVTVRTPNAVLFDFLTLVSADRGGCRLWKQLENTLSEFLRGVFPWVGT